MNMIINEFAILSPELKKAYVQPFMNKTNVIIGKKDSGKTTLARSILYTLGCDVKKLDFIDKFPENIYIIDININSDNYIIIRKKLKSGKGANFFKIIHNKKEFMSFYNTKDFSIYLNSIMNINLISLDKNNRKTMLYPNHIFLPFYTDQDYSWERYMVSTFNGLSFIPNIVKLILEYFTGVRANEYYELQIQKKNKKNEILELGASIKSKEQIITENLANIKIIEDINIDSFTKHYELVLGMYNNIISSEHEFKETLNQKIYRNNSLSEMKRSLDTAINNIIESELNHHCPNCNQKIYNDMETNYGLYDTKEHLIKEREIVLMHLKEVEEEIKLSQSELEILKTDSKAISKKLDSTSKIIDIQERASSFALNYVNDKLNDELILLRTSRDTLNEELCVIEEQLNKLNLVDVASSYKTNMISAFSELDLDFSYRNYYNSNLESANIFLSGTSKNQAFIAQYITIYNIILNNERTINIPMMLDTFVKDHFTKKEIEITTKYIMDNLNTQYQSFIYMKDELDFLNSIEDYECNVIKLKAKKNLLNANYDTIYKKFAGYILMD